MAADSGEPTVKEQWLVVSCEWLVSDSLVLGAHDALGLATNH